MRVPTEASRRALPVSRGRWADLGIRLASALLIMPVALFGLWVGGAVWAALILLLASGVAWEWVVLCRRLSRRRFAAAASGLLVVALAAASLIWLRADPVAGRTAALFLLVVVWTSDSGAYLMGRLLGGPRLAPAISPAKTWAGAAGGLVLAACVGELTASLLSSSAPEHGAAVAMLLSAAGQAGDLLESAAKRAFHVKDSSHLIPGHGGLLDRLDALIAAAPVAAGLAVLAGPGVVFFG